MKATINESGAIVIRAENSVEAYALRCYQESAKVEITDLKRCETSYWRGSKLIIAAIEQEQHP